MSLLPSPVLIEAVYPRYKGNTLTHHFVSDDKPEIVLLVAVQQCASVAMPEHGGLGPIPPISVWCLSQRAESALQ